MAKRFVFRLEIVLEHRRRVEREHELRVAEIERERLELEEAIREYQRGLDDCRADLRARLEGGVVVGDIKLARANSVALSARARQKVLELAGIHKRLQTARGALIRARTEREAIELLRQSQHAEWQESLNRAERAESDEIASRTRRAVEMWS